MLANHRDRITSLFDRPLGRAAWRAGVVAVTLVAIGALMTDAPAGATVHAAAPSGRAPAEPSSQPSIGAFAWLEGEWRRPIRGGTAFERWQILPDGGLAGESTVLRDGETVEIHTEALLLVAMGADIYYIARPPQNPYPTGFRLTSLDDGVAVFDNPTHDFPQRIIYRRTSADSMTATIEGPGDGGETQSIDFEFTRR